MKLWLVISKNGKTIAFNTRNLTTAQINYRTTKRELSIVLETIKYFLTIVLGHCIIIYIYHKNLTYEHFTTERVLSWRLLLEKYGHIIKDIKRYDNVTVCALTRQNQINYKVRDYYITRKTLAEIYCVDKLYCDILQLTYRMIDKYQWKDIELLKTI